MLVGRDRELLELRGALSRVADGGALFLFTGEPGIGKTRLAAELTSIARTAGVRVTWGRAWEAGGAPAFFPWSEALAGCGLAFPDAAPAVGDPGEARFALFRRVAKVLAVEAARQPLLMVLDDLHAADQPTLLLLDFLAHPLRAHPIIVVGTYRDLEARQRSDCAEVFARLERAARTFRLPALSASHIAALVDNAIDGADEQLAAELFAITHGNPLFVDEMLRDVQTRGIGRGLAIPLGVREIIRQRLTRVSQGVRRMFEGAAVLGVEVSVAALERMLGDLEPLLDEAAESGLVRIWDGRLRFSHSLYREGLYHDLPRTERQRLHQEAARALAGTGASLEEVTHHLLESGPADAAAAIDHAVRAAAHAVDVFAFEEATALLDRASAAIPRGPLEAPLRCKLLIGRGEARLRSGDATGRELCAQAAAIARELDDPVLLAHAGLAYGSVLIMGGVDPFLVGVLEEALARLPDADNALRPQVMARLATARQPSPPALRRRDIELGLEAIALARRVASRRDLLAVLHSASGVLYGAVDPSVRLPIMREQETLAEELGDTARLLNARVRLAIDYLELADFTSYAALASSYEALARRVGPAAEPWRVPLMRSMLALRLDRFDESRQYQDESRRIDCEQPRARRAQAFHRIGFFRAAERHAELRASIPELRNLWLAMPYGAILADGRVASVLARLGADDELRELLSRLPDDAFEDEVNAMALAEAVWATADRARAEQILPAVRFHAPRWSMYWFDCEIAEAPGTRLLAYIAAIAGDFDECDRLFERALQSVESVGRRSMAARMRFELGDLFVRQAREPMRAQALLAAARAQADELGLHDLVALIDRRHPSFASSSRPNASSAPGSLRGAFAIAPEGDYYAVSTPRGVLRLKRSRGMEYLEQLVTRPGTALHVLELVGSGEQADRGDAGELLDARAFGAYRARLETLRATVEEAEARADSEAAERARDEMETIAAQLARASKPGGRARRAESAVDRARSAVQRRIKDAISRISEHDPAVGAWLQRAVRTGNYCTFSPEA